MSRQLPKELMGERNNHVLIMDRSNVTHRAKGQPGKAACGARGTEVTLSQAIAFSGLWCGHASCYAQPYTTRGKK